MDRRALWGIVLASAAIGSCIAAGLAPERPGGVDGAKAAWEADIKESEASLATDRLAVLKLDSQVFLKPKQSVYLIKEKGGTRVYWTFDRAKTPKLTFDGTHATFTAGSITTDLIPLEDGYRVSDKIDISAQIVEVEPGKPRLLANVYDQDNPNAAKFKGLAVYPYDPSFVVVARLEPEKRFKAKTFQKSRGDYVDMYLAGYAVFSREDKVVRLPLYTHEAQPEKVKMLEAMFMDATTGSETYGVGRYLNVELDSFPSPTITLDFNYAYNPTCAHSPEFSCPVAETRLPFAVRAGEKVPLRHE